MLSQDSFLFSEVFTFEFGLTPQFTPVSERPRVFLFLSLEMIAVVALLATVTSPPPPPPTNILVAYHSQTNRTEGLAHLIGHFAGSETDVIVRTKPVTQVTCEDMNWYHGIALGSPVFWGMMSGVTKQFLDDVQQKCWDWPVKALRWKVGAGFATGAHLASGKSATIQALHTFFLSVQMVVVANEPPATCLLGACATNRNESAPIPVYTAEEKADAASLAKRLVTLSKAMRPLIDSGSF